MMRASAAILIMSAALHARTWAYGEAGTVAYERTLKLSVDVRGIFGRVPAHLLDPQQAASSLHYSQVSSWLQLTGGYMGERAATDLGSQFGVEWALRVGVTPAQLPDYGDKVPL